MIICICGKSGSGKSTIAKMICMIKKNVIHIDIDKIGHNSHNNDNIKKELISVFGQYILTDNNIDRKKLNQIVFSNKNEMNKLEKITWSYMEKEIDKIIDNNKDKIIILDYLLLPKTKYFNNSDLRILVDIPYKIRKQRVLERDNITEEQFNLREKVSIQYDKNKFEYVITDNNIYNIKKKVLTYE